MKIWLDTFLDTLPLSLHLSISSSTYIFISVSCRFGLIHFWTYFIFISLLINLFLSSSTFSSWFVHFKLIHFFTPFISSYAYLFIYLFIYPSFHSFFANSPPSSSLVVYLFIKFFLLVLHVFILAISPFCTPSPQYCLTYHLISVTIYLFISIRIRRMGKVMFSVCQSTPGGGGLFVGSILEPTCRL